MSRVCRYLHAQSISREGRHISTYPHIGTSQNYLFLNTKHLRFNHIRFHSGGTRYSTARAYLRPASRRANLHVMLNTLGSRVIVDPVTKKVTAVEYIKDGVTKTVGVNKEVIFCFLIIFLI